MGTPLIEVTKGKPSDRSAAAVTAQPKSGPQQRFHENVDRLHGPVDGENGRAGGLWEEHVQLRPSVLRHDSTAEDRAIMKFTGKFKDGYAPVDSSESHSSLVDFDLSKKENYPRHNAGFVWWIATDGTLCHGTMHFGGGWRDARSGAVVDGHHKGDAKVRPLGVSRRADREGAGFCLVTGRDITDDETYLASAIVDTLDEVRKGDYVDGMPNFQFFVVGDRKLVLRSSDDMFGDSTQARRRLNVGISESTRTGRWGIPGVQGMICDVVGEVERVEGFEVDVRALDGEMKTFRFDPARANEVAFERTGFELPFVQPIVRVGQKAMSGSSLFGPWPLQKLEGPNDSPGLCATLGGDLELVLDQIRAWYILTQAKLLPTGALGYPIEFAVPQYLRDVYMKVDPRPHVISGPPEDRQNRFSRRETPVRNKLKTAGIGFKVDLYDHSCRRQMVLDITRPKNPPTSKKPTKSKGSRRRPAGKSK